MSATNPPFNFAIDMGMLEKQISKNEQERMVNSLQGNIGAFGSGGPNGGAAGGGSSDPTDDIVPPQPSQSHGEPGLDTEFNTLDEPIWVTISRDLKVIREKFKQVLLPSANYDSSGQRDWDLWGPVFICVALSLLLRAPKGAVDGLEFTTIFSLAFFGCCIVTLNIKLLGGKISFLQTLCVIGYCLLPTVFSALACRLLSIFLVGGGVGMALRFVFAGFGFLWSTYASMAFLSDMQMERRKALGLFPVILFYLVVSWLVVAYT